MERQKSEKNQIVYTVLVIERHAFQFLVNIGRSFFMFFFYCFKLVFHFLALPRWSEHSFYFIVVFCSLLLHSTVHTVRSDGWNEKNKFRQPPNISLAISGPVPCHSCNGKKSGTVHDCVFYVSASNWRDAQLFSAYRAFVRPWRLEKEQSSHTLTKRRSH